MAQVPPGSRYDDTRLQGLQQDVEEAEEDIDKWKDEASADASLQDKLKGLRKVMDTAVQRLQEDIEDNTLRIAEAEKELKQLQVLQVQVRRTAHTHQAAGFAIELHGLLHRTARLCSRLMAS